MGALRGVGVGACERGRGWGEAGVERSRFSTGWSGMGGCGSGYQPGGPERVCIGRVPSQVKAGPVLLL